MKRLFILLFAIAVVSPIFAQKFEWLYSNTTQQPTTLRTESDAQGNTFIMGRYTGLMVHGNDTLSSHGGASAFFLTKIDAAGNRLWSKTFSPYNSSINDICIDANGYIYASIFCNSNIIYNDGDTTFSFPNLYSIVSFDNDGNVRWGIAHPFPSSWQPLAASLQHSGFYTAGYQGVSKIDSDGIIIWSKIATPAGIYFNGIACNDDNTVVASAMSGFAITGNFILDTVTVTINNYNADMALFRMDTTGSVLWGKVTPNLIGGQSYYYEKPLLVSPGSEIYHLYSKDYGVLNYVFGNDTIYNPYSPNSNSGAVLKYDANGNPVWASGAVYGDGNISVDGFIFSDNYDIILTGSTGLGKTRFGNQVFDEQGLGYSTFTAKVLQNGSYSWFKSDERLIGGLVYDYPKGITKGVSGTYHVMGYRATGFGSTFHLGCLSDSNSNPGVFVVNISENTEPVPVVDFNYVREGLTVYFEEQVENGVNYQWNFGNSQTGNKFNPNHIYSTVGSYNVCLKAENNCGSATKCKTVVLDGINKVHPNKISNSGYHKLQVSGGFSSDPTLVKFIKNGSADVIPDSVLRQSSGLLHINLKLNQIDTGYYDIIYQSPTFSDTLTNALLVQMPDSIKPVVTVTGPGGTRPNTWGLVKITVTNPSNVSYYGIPLHVLMNPNLENFVPVSEYSDSITQSILQQTQTHFSIINDNLNNDSLLGASFLLSDLPPATSKTLNLFVRTGTQQINKITAYTGGSYFTNSELTDMGLRMMSSCNFLPKCLQCALDILGFVPVVGCVSGGFNLGCAIGTKAAPGQPGAYFANVGANLAGTALSCAGATAAADDLLKVGSAAVIGGAIADLANSALGAGDDCGNENGCYPNNGDDWSFPNAASIDPNYKSGPQGATPANFLNKNDELNYIIHFENLDTATAPAAEVIIIDSLDLNVFDLSTFAFTGFGQTDSVINLDMPQQSFATEINLQPAKNAILRISGQLDTLTGVVRWAFKSLDPVTYDITDVLADGFLNPNVNPPEGEGFVSYKVRLKNSVTHLQSFTNSALIYFDTNAPIATNAYLNTIDTVKPVSNIQPLPATLVDSVFTLHWTGTDADAGISGYDIYISENDGPYRKLISLTKRDSVNIIGSNGSKYEFYSVATDRARNIEDTPVNPESNPDATTTITVGLNEPGALSQLTVVPIPSTGLVNISFLLSSTEQAQMVVTDLPGKDVFVSKLGLLSPGQMKQTLDLSHLNNGIYLLRIDAGKHSTSKKLVIQR